jgi:hypothetical protein
MRKIERDMVQSILDRRPFRKSNTSVAVEENSVSVYLFGNLIAEIDYESVTPTVVKLTEAGWYSYTTKSRLNAILQGLSLPFSIYQEKKDWFLFCPGVGSSPWEDLKENKFLALPLDLAA